MASKGARRRGRARARVLVLVRRRCIATSRSSAAARRGSFPAATAAAQAADVLQYRGSGSRMPRSEQVDERAEVALGGGLPVWPRRARAGRCVPARWWTRLLRPRPTVSASKAEPGTPRSGPAGAPRRAGAAPGRASSRSPCGRRRRARRRRCRPGCRTAGQVDVHVERRRRALALWPAATRSSSASVIRRGPGRPAGPAAGRRGPARPRGTSRLAPASRACSIRSATCHSFQRVERRSGSRPRSPGSCSAARCRAARAGRPARGGAGTARADRGRSGSTVVGSEGARGTTVRSCRGRQGRPGLRPGGARRSSTGVPAPARPARSCGGRRAGGGGRPRRRRAPRPCATRTVWSTTSSSSPTGTAGGRGRLVRSSRPE